VVQLLNGGMSQAQARMISKLPLNSTWQLRNSQEGDSVAGFSVNLPRHRLRHMCTRVTTILDVLHLSQPVYFAQLCLCVITVRVVFIMTVNCSYVVVDILAFY
jgi:hypothetical protein